MIQIPGFSVPIRLQVIHFLTQIIMSLYQPLFGRKGDGTGKGSCDPVLPLPKADDPDFWVFNPNKTSSGTFLDRFQPRHELL